MSKGPNALAVIEKDTHFITLPVAALDSKQSSSFTSKSSCCIIQWYLASCRCLDYPPLNPPFVVPAPHLYLTPRFSRGLVLEFCITSEKPSSSAQHVWLKPVVSNMQRMTSWALVCLSLFLRRYGRDKTSRQKSVPTTIIASLRLSSMAMYS
jgi:hypothetical protein